MPKHVAAFHRKTHLSSSGKQDSMADTGPHGTANGRGQGKGITTCGSEGLRSFWASPVFGAPWWSNRDPVWAGTKALSFTNPAWDQPWKQPMAGATLILPPSPQGTTLPASRTRWHLSLLTYIFLCSWTTPPAFLFFILASSEVWGARIGCMWEGTRLPAWT